MGGSVALEAEDAVNTEVSKGLLSRVEHGPCFKEFVLGVKCYSAVVGYERPRVFLGGRVTHCCQAHTTMPTRCLRGIETPLEQGTIDMNSRLMSVKQNDQVPSTVVAGLHALLRGAKITNSEPLGYR